MSPDRAAGTVKRRTVIRLAALTFACGVLVALLYTGVTRARMRWEEAIIGTEAFTEGGEYAAGGNDGYGVDGDMEEISGRRGDVCHVVGHPDRGDDYWQGNSRVVCQTGEFCVSQRGKPVFENVESGKGGRCYLANALYRSLRKLENCEEIRREYLYPAYHASMLRNVVEMPERRNVSSVGEMGDVEWLPGLTVFVPAYAYPGNIYHFAVVITTLTHTIDNMDILIAQHAENGKLGIGEQLRKTQINFVMHGSQNDNLWQKQLLQTMLDTRIQPLFDKVKLYYMSDTYQDAICGKNSVIHGMLGHVNAWPFRNASDIDIYGTTVAEDAVNFKRAAYQAFDMSHGLPPQGKHGVVQLPPLTVGYARRLGADAVGSNVHAIGTRRRFREDDEKWFLQMLHNETENAHVRLNVFTTQATDALREQVRNIGQVGFLVGIHGANLVNAIFMQPFGAMLEIFPKGVASSCYVGGSNSGLGYFRFESSDAASAEESGCGNNARCMILKRQRLVKIGRAEDRVRLREQVRKGIAHLLNLHRVFPTGVPVVYNSLVGQYEINVGEDGGE